MDYLFHHTTNRDTLLHAGLLSSLRGYYSMGVLFSVGTMHFFLTNGRQMSARVLQSNDTSILPCRSYLIET